MPPRNSLGGASPPNKRTPTKGGKELDESAARFDLVQEQLDEKLALAPLDQKKEVYRPGTPIKFYDEEVKRMHSAVDQQAESDRRAARRELRQPRPRNKGITLTGFLTRVALLYLAIAYFLVCPNDASRDRAVCRQIDSFSSRIRSYEPTFRPYYRTAQRKVDPYVRRTKKIAQPYVNKAKPYYSRADKVVTPRIKQAYQFYLKRVYPRMVNTIKSVRSKTRPFALKVEREYKKTLAPSVDWYSKSLNKWYTKRVEPSLVQFLEVARQYFGTISNSLSPVYTQGVPLVRHHYRNNLVPFSRSTYSATRKTYVSHVHPQLATASSHVHKIYLNKVSPSLYRFWSKFIAPQLDKIRERIFEFKAKEARVAAMKKVEKVSDEIAHQHGEEDFEDFIKELRDDTYVGETASPVAVEEVDVAPPSYSTNVPPPPSPEEQAALTAEKRAALEILQSTYEREITHLGQTEQKLLIKRLSEIRQHAIEDIPGRFDPVLEALDEEGDKMVGKLGRYFTKVSGDDKTGLEEKVEESQRLSEKAKIKVEKMKKKVEEEIADYRIGSIAKEEKAVEEAKNSITALVGKAQEELGFGWTWLDDVTHKDWQRYHGLQKAEENLHKSFSNLQSGEIRDSTLSSLDPYTLLDKYAKKPQRLIDVFSVILNKITIKGQKEIKVEWTGVTNEAQKAYEAAGEKMAGLADNVKVQASSIAGIEPTPTNIRETMASLATSAQLSASSLAAEALKHLPTGGEPTPTNLRQSAGFIVSEAQYKAAEAYARGSQQVYKAAGYEPSPTDLSQSAASIARAAQSSASSAYSNVVSDVPSSISSALAQASSVIDKQGENVVSSASSLVVSGASVVSSLAAPHSTFIGAAPVLDRLGNAKEHINEFFGDVSQGAIRAVGGEPSPTDVRQTATSLASVVSSAVSEAGSAVSSLAQPHTDFAKTASIPTVLPSASGGGGIKATLESLASSASSALHDVTRTTPEGIQETASSLASVAKESLSSLSSAAGSLAAPHPSYTKSTAAASIQSGLDQATGFVAKATAQAKSIAHDAQEEVKSAIHVEL